MARETLERLLGWLAEVDRAEESGFVELPDLADLPDHVRRESEFWCDEILAPAANPHDAEGVRHRLCRASAETPDLLEHTLSLDDLAISVIEGRNFVRVRVARAGLDLLALPAAERPAAVARAAERLFREPLRFQTCAVLGEGAMICTDAAKEPLLLAAWPHRVEAGIESGELWFLCYKRSAQRTGFCNPRQWFSDTGRAPPPAHRAARRAGRRAGQRPRRGR